MSEFLHRQWRNITIVELSRYQDWIARRGGFLTSREAEEFERAVWAKETGNYAPEVAIVTGRMLRARAEGFRF